MDQIAKLADTSRQSIHRIENGDQTPSLGLVARLIRASGNSLRADDFLPSRATPEATAPTSAVGA